MKHILLLFFVTLLTLFTKIQAQCNQIETITICDMTSIDNDNNGMADGIINLYDEYNAITGGSISSSSGTWFDPNFNFALDESTGNLHLWDLDYASELVTDYQFQLINTSSSCPDGILVTINLVLGPFSGFAVPVIGDNDVNVEICDIGVDPCGSSTLFDLYQVFLSEPSVHINGTWRYEGNSPNFLEIQDNRYLLVDVPYQPGVPLVDSEIFELIYSVTGLSPCATAVETKVKISAIREVFSGAANEINICETELINGDFDSNIDLRDDDYLVNEDIEGIWLFEEDTTGQITGFNDSYINLKAIYDDLYSSNPRFGCETYSYSYFVESRSAVCEDKTSTVKFTFYEYLRPFWQTGSIPEFCVNSASLPNSFNLNNLLEFTTENGVIYNYPPKRSLTRSLTSWQLISGPAAIGLDSFTGTINLSNITNANAGTYVFEYTVSPEYNCEVDELNLETIYDKPDGCVFSVNDNHPCEEQRAQVTIVIHPYLYAGEDTVNLEFCENDPLITSPLDLFSLITTNGVDDPIYQGTMGVWIDAITGNPVSNPVTLPKINNRQIFDFLYTTTTANGCTDTADLSFTVFEEYQPGISTTVDVCNSDNAFNLFDRLNGTPSNTGTWIGPNGFVSTDQNANFDPLLSDAGVYTYTVPDNVNDMGTVLCSGSQSTVTVTLHQSPNAGIGGLYAVCQSDLSINLVNYLDTTADPGGVFRDLSNTNALVGSVLDVSQLSSDRYNFQYEIQGHASCNLSTSIITISIQEVEIPITTNQIFCATEGATVANLTASNGLDFNWYETETSTSPLPSNVLLVDGEDYFVAALDSDNCESSKVSMTVTILPVDHVECNDCIKDGVSANNDGENDEFSLCNLPISYPNFEINIFNRYGSLVYKGNKNTPLFNGSSNVPLTMGNKLPSGVYFYVFDPKDGETKPFQGNFYLSR